MDIKTAVAVLTASLGLASASAAQTGDPCTDPPPRGLDPTKKISLGKKTLLDVSKPVIVAKYGVPIHTAIQRGDLVEMRALHDEVALALRVLSTKQGIAYAAVNGPDDAKIAEVTAALADLAAALDAACP
jgi:hypothetical protein